MIYENGVYRELTAEEIAEREAAQAADQHASRGR